MEAVLKKANGRSGQPWQEGPRPAALCSLAWAPSVAGGRELRRQQRMFLNAASLLRRKERRGSVHFGFNVMDKSFCFTVSCKMKLPQNYKLKGTQ